MTRKPANPGGQPPAGFRARKAAQICAYFATRAGGRIDKLKLSKLVYLAERRFLMDHHQPMLHDDLHSLEHGPVCSGALGGMEGTGDPALWDGYIRRHGRDTIVASRAVGRADLDHVSKAEFKVLQTVWKRFGGRTPAQLRNYTHANCPEYKEVAGGSDPISYQELFEALGAEDAVGLAQEVAAARAVDELWAEHG